MCNDLTVKVVKNIHGLAGSEVGRNVRINDLFLLRGEWGILELRDHRVWLFHVTIHSIKYKNTKINHLHMTANHWPLYFSIMWGGYYFTCLLTNSWCGNNGWLLCIYSLNATIILNMFYFRLLRDDTCIDRRFRESDQPLVGPRDWE